MAELNSAVEQAYQGIIPTLENPLPSIVNHDFVLSIMREIFIISIKTAYSKIQECKAKGIPIDLRDKNYLNAETEIENDIEIEKQDIFKKFGLLYYEDSPSLIVYKAIERFSKESLIFSRKIKKIEEEHRDNIERIMKDQMSRNQFENIIKDKNI